VTSALTGGQRDLTSEVRSIPEVEMPEAPVIPESVVGCRARTLRIVAGCSGVDWSWAPWVLIWPDVVAPIWRYATASR
jgi:hypothetical protein